jgi:aspartyl-tRNA(Asn)/glutamyl-tRNA(Gln) amidotransferase subunit A
MLPPRTIADAGRAIRSGELAPLELVEACLAQIDRHERDVRAWVVVDEAGARQAARQLGDELRRGNDRGPLHGIPIGIKDIVDVRGFPTRAGSRLRENDPPAQRDATVVARLRQAGAIILGKTVTTEFASFDPPPTRNPWNLERTPGGSSSGSAAGVATLMCLGAIGSQTGGSITRPASFCGIASSKPSFGRVSRMGVVPLSHNIDHVGPMARTVADLAILLAAIAGPDDEDPLATRESVPDYLAALDKPAPPRLGFLDTYHLDKAQEQVVGATRAALDVLRDRGAAIVSARLPGSFDDVHRMHRTVMLKEIADYYRELFARHEASFGPRIAELIREGLAISAADYQAGRAHQERCRRDLRQAIGEHDALVMPATVTTAPDASTTGDPLFNSLWSYSGLPTVSIPCGLADDGLPVSLQFIGRPFEEDRLLAAAAWCERQIRFDRLPPIVEASAERLQPARM